jgi:hypothetical protein
MSYRFLLPFICALASTEVVLWSSLASAQTPLTRAVVQNLRKQVRLMPNNQQPRPARVKDTLRPGDALATARASLAELRFNDQSVARIGEQALFYFTPNTRTFDLRNGTVLLMIPRGQGVTRMKTPNAAAGIKGSALFVRYNQATNTSFFGALTQSQIEISNHDQTQTRVLQPGEMATVVNNQLVSVQTFDLKTFYETSTLVEGLQLNQPNGADPSLDGVREETSDALKKQVPVSGEGVIETPSSLRMPQTLAENDFPSDVASQPVTPSMPGLLGASPINLPPAVISVDAAGKPLRVVPADEPIRPVADPTTAVGTVSGVGSGTAVDGNGAVGANAAVGAVTVVGADVVSGVVAGPATTSDAAGQGSLGVVGSDRPAAATANTTTGTSSALPVTTVAPPGPAPALPLSSNPHGNIPGGMPHTPANTPTASVVTPTTLPISATTPAGAVSTPAPSSVVSTPITPTASTPALPAAALAPVLPSVTSSPSASYTAPSNVGCCTASTSSRLTVITPVAPTVSTVTPTAVTPMAQPTVLTPSQSTPAVASPVVTPSVVAAPAAAATATVQSVPVTTTPVVATPVTTAPVVSTPAAVSAPVVSTPAAVSAPVVSTPAAVSAPVVSTPAAVSAPVVSTPAAVSAPVVSTPVTTTPVVTTPVVTTPAAATPAVTTPAVTTPVPSSSVQGVPLTQSQTPAVTSF